MDEREISRRGTRTYMPERLPPELAVACSPLRRSPAVAELVAGGRLASALRRELRARGIDPAMARLVLCLSAGAHRPRSIAWELGVSRTTASRMLDRAEQAMLVDKLYLLTDRRGTWARLTERGRAFRQRIEALLGECEPDDARFEDSYGLRACSKWDR